MLDVALSGKKGVGKTTIANNLVNEKGYVKLSFADPLKEICWRFLPCVMVKPKEDRREALQVIGTIFRDFNEDVWVDVLVTRVLALRDLYPQIQIVVDDLRYWNEFKALWKLGFNLIRIERDAELRRQWGYNVDDLHPSERELDDVTGWDLIIENNGPYPFLDATNEILEFLRLSPIRVLRKW